MIKHEHIHIFKTDIRTQADKQKLQPALELISDIHEWSVDIDDIDCVLRVISPTLTREDIATVVSNHGYHCAELI
jgi:hypothetical protein